ncbi:MAG: hypothetical protein Q9160_002435 [Pyrenula sp. 1 TL-2023]
MSNILNKAKEALKPKSPGSQMEISSPLEASTAAKAAATATDEDMDSKPAVICVFCGSSPGLNPLHMSAARSLAHAMHAAGARLVYGGGTRGIMGELAKTLVSLSGPQAVHGVIPRALIAAEEGYDKSGRPGTTKAAEASLSIEQLKKIDSGHEGGGGKGLLQETEFGLTTIVDDMHTRKRLMASKVMEGGNGSGFVALAGGYGTIEEVMEMVTWNQLGIHRRGIVLVNIAGYWDGLMGWVGNAVKEGFVGEGNRGILVEVEGPERVVEALRNYKVAEGRFVLDWSLNQS